MDNKKKRKILFSLLGYSIVCVIFYFIGKRVVSQWSMITQYEWDINWGLMFVSFLFVFIGLVIIAYVWIILVKNIGEDIKIKEGLKIYFYTSFSNYLPGKFWNVVCCAVIGRAKGYSGTLLGAAMLYLIFLTLTAAIFLSLASAAASSLGRVIGLNYKIIAGFLLIFSISIFVPKVIRFVLKFAKKILKRDIPDIEIKFKTLFISFILLLLHWLFEAMGFFIFIRSFYDLSWPFFIDIIFVFTSSAVIGYLVFFVPAGIGVREGGMLILLPFIMQAPVATAAALGYRLWFTVSVLLAILIVLGSLFVLERFKVTTQAQSNKGKGHKVLM